MVSVLSLVVFFSVMGGVMSLIGGVFLLAKKRWSPETMLTMISYAAGVLLAVSFFDLLPEAIELAQDHGSSPSAVLVWTLGAIGGFFLFERSFVWFHHHHGPHQHQPDPVVEMVWIGDTLHNAVDGLVITASFFASVPLGVFTAVAVAAHELPQEIADFSLYLAKGVGRQKTLILNLLSSLSTVVAAVGAYFFWEIISPWQPQLLAFTAGMFIYIAGSDLIPELHEEYRRQRVWIQAVAFLVGIVTIWLVGRFLAV